MDGTRILGLAGLLCLTGCWQGPHQAGPPRPAVVTVEPATAALTEGKTMAFAARIDGEPATDVAWSVLEAGGGSVDAAGTYHAPSGPGVFTVRAQSKDGPGQGAAKVNVVAPPAGEILAPARMLPQTAQTARIVPVAGSQYHWTIAGGLVTAGTDTATVSFQAGDGPRLTLACRVTNAAGDVLNTSLELPVAAPVTLAIKPAAVTLTVGRTMKFGYDLVGGTSLKVTWNLGEPGAGSLDGAGNYVAPAVPGRYTVRVASVDDPTMAAVAAVKVVPEPPQTLFAPDTFLPGAKGLEARVPELEGMTYAWEIEGGTLTTGAGGPSVLFDAGPGPAVTLRCRITNEAGDSFAAMKVITVLQ